MSITFDVPTLVGWRHATNQLGFCDQQVFHVHARWNRVQVSIVPPARLPFPIHRGDRWCQFTASEGLLLHDGKPLGVRNIDVYVYRKPAPDVVPLFVHSGEHQLLAMSHPIIHAYHKRNDDWVMRAFEPDYQDTFIDDAEDADDPPDKSLRRTARLTESQRWLYEMSDVEPHFDGYNELVFNYLGSDEETPIALAGRILRVVENRKRLREDRQRTGIVVQPDGSLAFEEIRTTVVRPEIRQFLMLAGETVCKLANEPKLRTYLSLPYSGMSHAIRKKHHTLLTNLANAVDFELNPIEDKGNVVEVPITQLIGCSEFIEHQRQFIKCRVDTELKPDYVQFMARIYQIGQELRTQREDVLMELASAKLKLNKASAAAAAKNSVTEKMRRQQRIDDSQSVVGGLERKLAKLDAAIHNLSQPINSDVFNKVWAELRKGGDALDIADVLNESDVEMIFDHYDDDIESEPVGPHAMQKYQRAVTYKRNDTWENQWTASSLFKGKSASHKRRFVNTERPQPQPTRQPSPHPVMNHHDFLPVAEGGNEARKAGSSPAGGAA